MTLRARAPKAISPDGIPCRPSIWQASIGVVAAQPPSTGTPACPTWSSTGSMPASFGSSLPA